jgi:hypothetical protein
MQPTTPFKTGSWNTRAAEIIGWVLLAAFWYWDRWATLSLPMHIALGVSWSGYIFVRLCSLVHWHRNAQRGEGLEQHFMQMGVVASYAWAITNLVAAAHFFTLLIYLVAAVLATVSAINATLLYIYNKDRSTVPINFYSHRKTNEEES